MRNFTPDGLRCYACNGCYGKRSINLESQAKKLRSTPTKHLYPKNSGLYPQYENTLYNTHDRNSAEPRIRQERPRGVFG